ncbi:TetR/AcrR family transcriptional regulator [Nakamurella endophytica]|uniref:TetR/AcrR family transcriptional regulator n=1 Tax=Nakamurella endophytica TaxID=1748367 RepID=UPI00166774D7|nr:TetR/AcrR family transcriptional regulator [Nakamurella endophytica]
MTDTAIGTALGTGVGTAVGSATSSVPGAAASARAAGDGPSGGMTARRDRRRRQIVAAAADLFADRGYAAVGMDDIGAAAGITGPAIYRHFGSKSAVLVAVFDGILDAVTATPPPDPAGAAGSELGQLVASYTRAVAVRRRLMAVFVREVHHLPPDERAGLVARQRTLVRRWRALVARIHPDWPAESVRTAVHGVFGMLNAVGTFDSPLDDTELAATLDLLARRALDLPTPGPDAAGQSER